MGDSDTWEEQFQYNPTAKDDGWWIDEVELTGLVATPATVTADTKDNSALPALNGIDTDLDGRPTLATPALPT